MISASIRKFLPAVILVSVVGCAAIGKDLKPPRVTLVDLRVKSVTVFESALEIDIRIQNPNSRAFQTKGIDFDLEINGRRLATGLSSAAVDVPSLGTAILPITVYSNMLDILRGVHSIRGTEKVAYSLRGRIHLKANSWFPMTLPFQSNGELIIIAPESSQNSRDVRGQT